MLSFIIIGRNEGWKLTKCFESVFKTISGNELLDYEVIYIDSKSTDDSIVRAKQFKQVKIFQLSGDINAAIARNLGTQESKGDVLFFLDGDMELIPESFSTFYTEKKGLVYPFVSGDWDNYFYSHDWRYLSKDNGLGLKTDQKKSTVGGLFFIERGLWEGVGGMRTEFIRGEDIDLALRLAKQGNLLLRKKELLVHHHMISYLDKNRKWKMLFSGADLYGRSLLYRNHIFNQYIWKRLIRNDYSVWVLLLSSILAFVLHSIIPLSAFLLILLPKTIHTKDNHIENYFYFALRDLFVLFGVLFFWPKKMNNIKYDVINSEL